MARGGVLAAWPDSQNGFKLAKASLFFSVATNCEATGTERTTVRQPPGTDGPEDSLNQYVKHLHVSHYRLVPWCPTLATVDPDLPEWGNWSGYRPSSKTEDPQKLCGNELPKMGIQIGQTWPGYSCIDPYRHVCSTGKGYHPLKPTSIAFHQNIS